MSSPRNSLRKSAGSAEVATLISAVADKITGPTARSDVEALGPQLQRFAVGDLKTGAAQAGMTLSGSGKGDLIKQIVSRLSGRIGSMERTQFRGA